MSVQCNSCGQDFDEFVDLAKHIMGESKRTHRHGRKWAASLLLKVRKLDSKKELKERVPLSEEDKENRREIQRQVQLSGAKSFVNTICPKCKTRHAEALEVEYVRSPLAWKTLQGTLLIMCAGCRR